MIVDEDQRRGRRPGKYYSLRVAEQVMSAITRGEVFLALDVLRKSAQNSIAEVRFAGQTSRGSMYEVLDHDKHLKFTMPVLQRAADLGGISLSVEMRGD